MSHQTCTNEVDCNCTCQQLISYVCIIIIHVIVPHHILLPCIVLYCFVSGPLGNVRPEVAGLFLGLQDTDVVNSVYYLKCIHHCIMSSFCCLKRQLQKLWLLMEADSYHGVYLGKLWQILLGFHKVALA